MRLGTFLNNMGIDIKRVGYFIVSLIFGIIAGYQGQPLIHNNSQAINIIVTVFSVLAGFLVAIMTIIGEPGASFGKSWRACEKNRKNVFARLVRQKWMFYLYLSTLGIIFLTSLVKDISPVLTVWLERIYLGGATTAFLLSLGLPASLLNIQLERHETIIKAKRNKDGIKD